MNLQSSLNLHNINSFIPSSFSNYAPNILILLLPLICYFSLQLQDIKDFSKVVISIILFIILFLLLHYFNLPALNFVFIVFTYCINIFTQNTQNQMLGLVLSVIFSIIYIILYNMYKPVDQSQLTVATVMFLAQTYSIINNLAFTHNFITSKIGSGVKLTKKGAIHLKNSFLGLFKKKSKALMYFGVGASSMCLLLFIGIIAFKKNADINQNFSDF